MPDYEEGRRACVVVGPLDGLRAVVADQASAVCPVLAGMGWVPVPAPLFIQWVRGGIPEKSAAVSSLVAKVGAFMVLPAYFNRSQEVVDADDLLAACRAAGEEVLVDEESMVNLSRIHIAGPGAAYKSITSLTAYLTSGGKPVVDNFTTSSTRPAHMAAALVGVVPKILAGLGLASLEALVSDISDVDLQFMMAHGDALSDDSSLSDVLLHVAGIGPSVDKRVRILRFAIAFLRMLQWQYPQMIKSADDTGDMSKFIGDSFEGFLTERKVEFKDVSDIPKEYLTAYYAACNLVSDIAFGRDMSDLSRFDGGEEN